MSAHHNPSFTHAHRRSHNHTHTYLYRPTYPPYPTYLIRGADEGAPHPYEVDRAGVAPLGAAEAVRIKSWMSHVCVCSRPLPPHRTNQPHADTHG